MPPKEEVVRQFLLQAAWGDWKHVPNPQAARTIDATFVRRTEEPKQEAIKLIEHKEQP